MKKWTVALLAVAFLTACRPKVTEESKSAPPTAAAPATPVRIGTVARATLPELVTAPGRTAALVQQKVRAPFAGTLTELSVLDGDAVRRGQIVGSIVSRESEAALSGAREMEREARTEAEKQDAERALVLAQKSLVRAPLKASADGRVLSHSASQGDRVSEDQEILMIEDSASIVFVADVAQGAVSRVRPGQAAQLEIGGRQRPVTGVVRTLLPSANAADFTAPVRIDLQAGTPPLALGLFGTARITVATRANVLVVPEAALVRDDVTGVTRAATLRDEHAHWVVVTSGVRDGDRVEIASGGLAEGDRIIVAGQVGLPEGAAVSTKP